MTELTDEQLSQALNSAINQVEEYRPPDPELLNRLRELEASRGKGELPGEVLEGTLEAIEGADPALLNDRERGSGPAGGTGSPGSGQLGPSPLAELEQVLLDLKAGRSERRPG